MVMVETAGVMVIFAPATSVSAPDRLLRLVTPPVAVEAIVIVPAPGVMVTPVPAVRLAATGAAPVEPIRSGPLVSAAASLMAPLWLVMIRLLLRAVVLLVPPRATVTGATRAMVPLLVIVPPDRPAPAVMLV